MVLGGGVAMLAPTHEAVASGSNRTKACVTSEVSDFKVVKECKDSGSRCETVSDCM